MAHALYGHRPHRASGQLAAHVLETMLSFEKSSNEGRHQQIGSKVERPAALDEDEFQEEAVDLSIA